MLLLRFHFGFIPNIGEGDSTQVSVQQVWVAISIQAGDIAEKQCYSLGHILDMSFWEKEMVKLIPQS